MSPMIFFYILLTVTDPIQALRKFKIKRKIYFEKYLKYAPTMKICTFDLSQSIILIITVTVLFTMD